MIVIPKSQHHGADAITHLGIFTCRHPVTRFAEMRDLILDTLLDVVTANILKRRNGRSIELP